MFFKFKQKSSFKNQRNLLYLEWQFGIINDAHYTKVLS